MQLVLYEEFTMGKAVEKDWELGNLQDLGPDPVL